MITNSKIHQLTNIINNPICEPVEIGDIISCFANISQKHPENVAIFDDGKSYTYFQFAKDVDRLQSHLQQRGISEGGIVAVAIGRNYHFFVAILAVLKSGAAFLPIDPTLPEERKLFYCKDANAALILVDTDVPSICKDIRTLSVKDCLNSAANSDDMRSTYTRDSLAYVIYTSGSTGIPKGVKISRKALTNFISGAIGLYQINENDRVLQFSNLTFDASIEEIFCAFCTGASLYLRTSEMLLANELIDFSHLHQITVWDLPTAFWRQIIQSDMYQEFPLPDSLRLVVIGGEAVKANDVIIWNKKKVKHRLFNTYGPTETTVVALAFEIKSDYDPAISVPIGQPLPGYKIYITDPDRNIVDQGIAGELLISGDSVADGYLNREHEENKAFILFNTPDSGLQRCYCTGDLVIAGADGLILYAGRADRQVKIRGYRIEPDEIESVISSYNGAEENVVIVREDSPEDKRLIAYIAVKNESRPDASDLRLFLKSKLPAYMMPSAFVFIDKFPLTPNGKINLKALPAPDKSNGQTFRSHIEPRNSIEKELASIWTELLKIEKIGVDDNFFELGGHSLVATMLISRIYQTFGLWLSLSTIYDKQTLEEIGAEIERMQNDGYKIPPTQTIPHSETGSDNFSLSPGQKRLWFVENFEPENLAYNIPLKFEINGAVDTSILEQSIGELIRRHATLRTLIQTVDGVPVQRILPPYNFKLDVVDLESLPETERIAQLENHSHNNEIHHFDLESGPLFVCKIVRLSSDKSVLLLNFHHIITDGWSVKIFMDELGLIYSALKEQKPLNLPELPITYTDYANWQNEWLQGEESKKQLDYWVKELKGAPELLQIPMDFQRPKNQTYDGDEVDFLLDLTLTEQLQEFSKQHNSSLFATLLSIFNSLIVRYTSQEEFVIGVPIAGRIHKELESLHGMVINNFPLRITPKDNMTFPEMLEHCKTKFFQAYDNQELPLDRIVEELKLTRHANISPLFQVMFNHLTMFDEEVSLAGAMMRR